LPAGVLRAIERAERLTRGGRTLRLRLAIDYSSRDSLCRAAALLAKAPVDGHLDEAFAGALARVEHAGRIAPPVDVFVRTGGERRLSDFLLWESAYAELFFRPEPWPDFSPGALAEVLVEFGRRERRFGGLGVTTPAGNDGRYRQGAA